MSAHILVVEPDSHAPTMQPHHPDERQWSIECPHDNGCSGWLECKEPHEVEGHGSAAEGPEDATADKPWADAEEFEFHGVMHTWKPYEHGWTVPYPGCVVAGSDWASPPDGWDELPYGRYPIEDDWDDTTVVLDFVHPIPGRCPSSTKTPIGTIRWCEHHDNHTGHHASGNWGWE